MSEMLSFVLGWSVLLGFATFMCWMLKPINKIQKVKSVHEE